MQRFSSETKKGFSEITEEAQEKLLAYGWPGNVRELANVIERAVVLGQGPKITPHDLPSRIIGIEGKTPSDSLSYHETMETTRRALIVRALDQAQGNRAAAAKALGLHRTHLMKLIKSLGIDK
jgi:two-component system response regulator AtoC